MPSTATNSLAFTEKKKLKQQQEDCWHWQCLHPGYFRLYCLYTASSIGFQFHWWVRCNSWQFFFFSHFLVCSDGGGNTCRAFVVGCSVRELYFIHFFRLDSWHKIDLDGHDNYPSRRLDCWCMFSLLDLMMDCGVWSELSEWELKWNEMKSLLEKWLLRFALSVMTHCDVTPTCPHCSEFFFYVMACHVWDVRSHMMNGWATVWTTWDKLKSRRNTIALFLCRRLALLLCAQNRNC